jgi:major intracellular serine protease
MNTVIRELIKKWWKWASVNYLQFPSRFSNTNSELDLVAPGERIISTYTGNQYAVFSGIARAGPHISGELALLIEHTEKKQNRRLTEPVLKD